MPDEMTTEAKSLRRVGGALHELVHRRQHCRLYLPLFRLAFGDETTWADKTALVAFAGRGREAEMFAPYCGKLILTDSYGSCVEMLQQRFELADRPYITVVQGNGHTLPAPDRCVDMVTALVALMHIRPLDIRESYAQEINRVLRPGGRALIQVAQFPSRNGVSTWEQPNLDPPYTVDSGGENVGFLTEQEAYLWWERYLAVQYVIRTPTFPPDQLMQNWWWIIAERRG